MSSLALALEVAHKLLASPSTVAMSPTPPVLGLKSL